MGFFLGSSLSGVLVSFSVTQSSLRLSHVLENCGIPLSGFLNLFLFSLILDQAEEVHLANKARLGDQNKNPFRRAKFLGLPLLRRSFSQVEDITLALAARGFRDDIPLRLPKLELSNIIPLLIFLVFLMALWWFQF
jgi:energy-coupling factor transporter transmembrane protein EcfT